MYLKTISLYLLNRSFCGGEGRTIEFSGQDVGVLSETHAGRRPLDGPLGPLPLLGFPSPTLEFSGTCWWLSHPVSVPAVPTLQLSAFPSASFCFCDTCKQTLSSDSSESSWSLVFIHPRVCTFRTSASPRSAQISPTAVTPVLCGPVFPPGGWVLSSLWASLPGACSQQGQAFLSSCSLTRPRASAAALPGPEHQRISGPSWLALTCSPQCRRTSQHVKKPPEAPGVSVWWKPAISPYPITESHSSDLLR